MRYNNRSLLWPMLTGVFLGTLIMNSIRDYNKRPETINECEKCESRVLYEDDIGSVYTFKRNQYRLTTDSNGEPKLTRYHKGVSELQKQIEDLFR